MLYTLVFQIGRRSRTNPSSDRLLDISALSASSSAAYHWLYRDSLGARGVPVAFSKGKLTPSVSLCIFSC